MRSDSIVLAALMTCSLWSGLAKGAEPPPPTPHAPKSSGTRSGPAARETPREIPGAPAAAPAGAAPTTEPVVATDAPPAEIAGPLVAADLQLLKKLHEDNQKDMEMGKLAQEKGAMAQTKAFGRKLAVDSEAAERKISSYLKRKKLDMSILVAVKTSGPPEHDLGGKSGNDFDRAFAALMVDGRSKAIDVVKERRAQTIDPHLKSLLAAWLPTLQRHLRTAQAIAEKSNAKI